MVLVVLPLFDISKFSYVSEIRIDSIPPRQQLSKMSVWYSVDMRFSFTNVLQLFNSLYLFRWFQNVRLCLSKISNDLLWKQIKGATVHLNSRFFKHYENKCIYEVFQCHLLITTCNYVVMLSELQIGYTLIISQFGAIKFLSFDDIEDWL